MSQIVVVRHYNRSTDDPYIYSSWGRYCWYSPKEPILIPKKKFFQEKNKEIKFLLERADVRVACMKGTPYFILGFIVVYQGKIEWLCVKKEYHQAHIDELLKSSMKGKIHEGTEGKDLGEPPHNEQDSREDDGAGTCN